MDSKVAPQLPISIQYDNGLQNIAPAMSAMDVAEAQGALLQIAETEPIGRPDTECLPGGRDSGGAVALR